MEVIGTEISVEGAILEHVIDRREERGGDGTDRLLRAAPALQTQELGLQVTALLVLGGPSALDEGSLEPRIAVAQASGSALSGTLVLTRTEAHPRQEVPGGEKAAHIGADLGDNRFGAEIAHARGRADQFDGITKGLDICLDPRIDVSDPDVETVDLLELETEQKAVVFGY